MTTVKQTLLDVFKVFAILAVALQLTGCSLLFVRSPPDIGPRGHRPPMQPCTSGKTGPVLDTLMTIAQAARIIAAIAVDDDVYGGGDEGDTWRAVDIGTGLALGGLFLGSAVSGYRSTSTCRKYKSTDYDPDPRVPEYAPTRPPQSFVPNMPRRLPKVSPAKPTACKSDIECGPQKLCEFGHCLNDRGQQ